MSNNPNNYIIAGNDEHGINPPTLGKRTPIMPYINRPFYENEFNYPAKVYFFINLLRTGFNVFDVKPERNDISISTRVSRVNRARPTMVITFAYNASGSGLVFTSANGVETYYSPYNTFSTSSRGLSQKIFEEVVEASQQRGRGVFPISIGLLTSVNTVASLLEAGFMTNFNEAKLMVDPDYQNKIAEACVKAVCRQLNVDYIEPFINGNQYQVLRRGNRGKAVEQLQYLLVLNGYRLNGIDGIFGSSTQNAVNQFQQDNNLIADGIIGSNTWSSLLVLNPQNQLLKQGSKGAYVRYLQQKLLSKLYPVGNIDADFGIITLNAVKEFQQENGLVVDGIVGRNTWNKLIQIGGGRPLQ